MKRRMVVGFKGGAKQLFTLLLMKLKLYPDYTREYESWKGVPHLSGSNQKRGKITFHLRDR